MTHNLKDYSFAKKMVEEVPQAVKTLEASRDALKQYQGFNAIAKVMGVMEGAILNLESSLPYFQGVVKDKGGQIE